MMQMAALVTLLAFGQGEPKPEVERTTSAERLAQDLAGLKTSTARQAQGELHKLVMEVVSKHLAVMQGEPFAPSTLGGVKRKELEFCQAWNTPSADRAGAIPAQDFKNPDQLPALLCAYSKALKEMGVELLVVPIPLRLQVYPEHLTGVPAQKDFAGYDAGMAPTLQFLAESGVEVLDLLPVFAAQRYSESKEHDARLYFDFDVHWTPRGCLLAAEEIARRIQGSDWFVQGSDTAGKDFIVRSFRGTWTVAKNRRYDVAAAKKPIDVWFEKVVNDKGASAHKRNSGSPIMLVGDSFSGLFKSESADIASSLYARFGQSLDVISIPGGGSALWKSIGRRRRETIEGKRVVIWLCSVLDFGRACKPGPLFKD
ncbi:MAG: hypothetical protein ACI8X5_003528 [Planctomycetota bacterium]|jgi:hypothetical protein